MIEGIETYYEQIGHSIQEMIPEAWTTARMDVIFYSDGSSYEGEYTRQADGKARAFGTTLIGERAFRELRKMFKDAGKPLWGQATFELHADGKFKMTWGYDNCDENGDTIFNEEEELKRVEERHKRLTSA